MGASPSQHLEASTLSPNGVQWPLQDDMGVVIALPPVSQPIRGNGVANRQRPVHELVSRRVLVVQSGSPAAASGLVPWLDFIVGVDGKFFAGDASDSLTKGMEPGRKTKLHVYNAKLDAVRDCILVPTRSEGHNDLFLGLKISTWQAPDVECLDKSIRVLAVMRKSPAFEAGLEPEVDYLLGSTEHGAFSAIDDLEYALTDKEGRTVDLYVYNSSRDDIRLVSLRPRTGWSDDGGLLGAELANGIIHRIPHSCRRTTGKDRATSSEQSLTKNDRVRTPEGTGEVLERHPDGASTVRLDWGLGPDVHVVGRFSTKNVDIIGSA